MIPFFQEKPVSYLAERGLHSTGVIHVGAAAGVEFGAFQQLGAENFVWIEPLEQFIGILQKKFGRLPNHIILRELAGEEVKETQYWEFEKSWGASSQLEPKLPSLGLEDQLINERTMVVRPLDILLKTHEVDPRDYNTLALNCRGAELKVLYGATETLETTCFIFSVVWRRKGYDDGCTVREIDEFLGESFERIETVWIDKKPWGFALYSRKWEEPEQEVHDDDEEEQEEIEDYVDPEGSEEQEEL